MPKLTLPAAGGAMPAASPSRRRFLGALAAAPALTALPGLAVAAPPDPVFAAIDRHRAIVAAWNPKTDSDADWDAAADIEGAAWGGLIGTQPTTLAGVRAYAAYVSAKPDLDMLSAGDGPAEALAVIAAALAELVPTSPTPLPPALAVAAALVSAGPQDPIFAMIAEWLALRKKIDGSEADAADADETRFSELTLEMLRTVPTTLPGALALSEIGVTMERCQGDAEAVLASVAACLRAHRARLEASPHGEPPEA